jgi:hypothetical protein
VYVEVTVTVVVDRPVGGDWSIAVDARVLSSSWGAPKAKLANSAANPRYT